MQNKTKIRAAATFTALALGTAYMSYRVHAEFEKTASMLERRLSNIELRVRDPICNKHCLEIKEGIERSQSAPAALSPAPAFFGQG